MMFARRAAFVLTGAMGIAVTASVLLVLPAAGQEYLLPGVLGVLVATVAALQVWERPALGVAAVVLLIAVPLGTTEEGRGISVTLPDIAAAFLAGIVALRTLVAGDLRRLRSWVLLPLAGVVIAGSIVTAAAADPGESFIGLVRYVEIFVVVPAATYLAIRSRRDLWLILGSVVVIGVVEGVLGTYQYFTGTGAEYGESGSRAVGTFGAYGIMGMAHVVTYALLVAAAAFAALRGGNRYPALLLAVALAFPLAFSFSRGYWIAAVVGVVTILALTNRRMLVAFVLAGCLALGALSVSGDPEDQSNSLTSRLTSIYSVESSPDQSVKDRYALWQASREMWADHPLTGVGLKNFPYFRDSYVPLDFSGGSDIADPGSGYRRVELLSPHSLYWLILSEQGLAGALAYGTLFLTLGVAGIRRLRAVRGAPVEKVFGLSCVAFLSCYLVSSIYGDIGGTTEMLNSVFLGGLVWFASGVELDEEV